MKKILCALFLFTFCQVSFSQITPAWVSTYGGNPSLTYSENDMATDKSGNVYVYAREADTSYNDTGVILKYNSSGALQWINKYGGLEPYGKIKVDKVGNVYIMSRFPTLSAHYDYLILKYYPSGAFAWSVDYNDSTNGNDTPRVIAIDDSLNVYVSGSSDGVGIATIKYDSSGIQQWIAGYDDGGNPFGIVVDSSQNIYLTGIQADSLNNIGVMIIKYNSAGSLSWQRVYNWDVRSAGSFIDISKDNFLYVVGTDGDFGYGDYLCLKYDTAGNQIWASKYNWQDSITPNMSDVPLRMALDDSGNVYITGEHDFYNINSGFATLKFNSQGVLQWTRVYDDGIYQYNGAWGLSVDASGNVYVSGESYDSLDLQLNFVTIKYDLGGNTTWLAKYTVGQQNCMYPGLGLDSIGNVYISGACADINTLKYDWTTGFLEYPVFENDLSLGPNPFTSFLKIESSQTIEHIDLFNLLGEKVPAAADYNLLTIDCSLLPPGIYILQASGDGKTWHGKVIKE